MPGISKRCEKSLWLGQEIWRQEFCTLLGWIHCRTLLHRLNKLLLNTPLSSTNNNATKLMLGYSFQDSQPTKYSRFKWKCIKNHLCTSSESKLNIDSPINSLSATGQAVRFAAISWKMPCTLQSTLFIFQVVKLHFYRAAGNTLINTVGTSKFSYSRTSFSATGCYKNKYSIEIS